MNSKKLQSFMTIDNMMSMKDLQFQHQKKNIYIEIIFVSSLKY